MSETNWKFIVTESESIIDHQFMYGNRPFTYLGPLHGSDDFYYVMYHPDSRELRLSSCVGSIENAGFEHIPEKCIKCLKEG